MIKSDFLNAVFHFRYTSPISVEMWANGGYIGGVKTKSSIDETTSRSIKIPSGIVVASNYDGSYINISKYNPEYDK